MQRHQFARANALMGHSKIQTTMVYVHLTAEEVYRQYAQAVAQCLRRIPSVPS